MPVTYQLIPHDSFIASNLVLFIGQCELTPFTCLFQNVQLLPNQYRTKFKNHEWQLRLWNSAVVANYIPFKWNTKAHKAAKLKFPDSDHFSLITLCVWSVWTSKKIHCVIERTGILRGSHWLSWSCVRGKILRWLPRCLPPLYIPG